MEAFTHPNHGKYKVIGTRPVRHDGEDKVTGRAQYAADVYFPDLLYGHVLRSPHAHAKILSVDTSKAEALPGVLAVTTSADLPRLEDRLIESGEGVENMRYMTDRILAADKALFKGHPIAAVAATDPWLAAEAVGLIEVQYEVLRAVTDVVEAMSEGAPLLFDQITTTIMGKKELKATNVCMHTRHQQGDPEAGFKEADVIIEREFKTKTVHQGYIELHSATALARADGQITVWISSQGPFWARDAIAMLLKKDLSKIRVIPMEIGGGFGGKIPVYLEPLAVLLSEKTGRPVKLGMSRADVFQTTGPASSTASKIKLGFKKDGTLVAAQVWMAYEAGAYPGTWGAMGAMCVLAPYRIPHSLIDVYDVLTNTPKVAAYRAPSSPQALWGVESIMDEAAQKLGIDPIDLRLKNAGKEGDTRADGVVWPRIGLIETLEAAKNSEHYKSPPPSAPNQARGVALGYWHNAGLQSSAVVGINLDGTANVITGSVDIGGTRASMAIIAAETLGLKAEEVRPSVADTDSIGHTDVTGGSRVTHTTGYAVYLAAMDAIEQMKARVAKLWDCKQGEVVFDEGAFRNVNNSHEPITVRQLAPQLPRTGGPVQGQGTISPKTVGAAFGCHVADIEVDTDTGKVTILRYTAVQDVGTAIHPSYVEGQMIGGAVQGIGWALNEEYIHDDQGRMMNPGFLDYRVPTSLDVPNIDTIIVEVPSPGHPYGVRGVGETPIVPPMGALHNAMARALEVRIRELPMSPPKVVAALKDKHAKAGQIAQAIPAQS
ncbi:MAG: xanthine dehydrogenase family protein molybdopterin-binding subunit [SAR324 cluster bacterium]|nr:xanthine dehydrogenase family protein molybdopterin-binding subunit [SAR324 cluster bacterium]